MLESSLVLIFFAIAYFLKKIVTDIVLENSLSFLIEILIVSRFLIALFNILLTCK